VRLLERSFKDEGGLLEDIMDVLHFVRNKHSASRVALQRCVAAALRGGDPTSPVLRSEKWCVPCTSGDSPWPKPPPPLPKPPLLVPRAHRTNYSLCVGRRDASDAFASALLQGGSADQSCAACAKVLQRDGYRRHSALLTILFLNAGMRIDVGPQHSPKRGWGSWDPVGDGDRLTPSWGT
jgi:hypothetical protein